MPAMRRRDASETISIQVHEISFICIEFAQAKRTRAIAHGDAGREINSLSTMLISRQRNPFEDRE
jgi:hypothetical protein